VATNRHCGNMVVSFVSAVDVWLSQHGQQTRITIGQNRRVKVSWTSNGVNINVFYFTVFLFLCWTFLISLQVDGNAIDTPAYQINDLVEIHEEHGFVIVNAFNKFIVHFDGHSSLVVRVSEIFYGSLCGMCGNFNGNPAMTKCCPVETSLLMMIPLAMAGNQTPAFQGKNQTLGQ